MQQSYDWWCHFGVIWLHIATGCAIVMTPETWTASAMPSWAGVGPNKSDAFVRREAPEAIPREI